MDIRNPAMCRGGTSFERDDGKPGIGERLGENGAGPTVTDDDRVDRSCRLPSRLVPAMETGRADRDPGLIDPVGEVGPCSRKSDPVPGGHIAVSAVDRVGKVAFPGVFKQLGEETRRRDPLKGDLPFSVCSRNPSCLSGVRSANDFPLLSRLLLFASAMPTR